MGSGGRSTAVDHECTPLAPLWHPARQDEHSEIVIEPESGDVIGTRTLVGFGNPTLPAGTVSDRTTVTTTVVDNAP